MLSVEPHNFRGSEKGPKAILVMGEKDKEKSVRKKKNAEKKEGKKRERKGRRKSMRKRIHFILKNCRGSIRPHTSTRCMQRILGKEVTGLGSQDVNKGRYPGNPVSSFSCTCYPDQSKKAPENQAFWGRN